MRVPSDDAARDASCTDVDVIVIGAGIAGIGAAYRISRRNPKLTYTILERRARIGGTWDLFRYPGVRSDSSIFTLSFPFEPWTRDEAVADGADILEYVTATARKHGIDRHIRFNTHVRSANWDSATDMWTITVDEDGAQRQYRSRFVFFGTGYYDYDAGYAPDFPGAERFGGVIIHPQHWPEKLDYTGKNVVVIGSGATAVSLIPALAERAAKVTMLQRSPTYLITGSRYNPNVARARKRLSPRASHHVIRSLAAFGETFGWVWCRTLPERVQQSIREEAIANLPAGYDVDTHFKPNYKPWDQRMCLIPDADLYAEIAAGRAEMVTDHIDHFDGTGIALKSGGHLNADIIVTATGLRLQALGGARISVDGVELGPRDRFFYKTYMLEDVPNLFWCVGHTNGSWTLRSDMTARAAAKLLAYMTSHGYTHAYPHLGGRSMAEKPPWNADAGYVARALHAQPKSGTRRPWIVRRSYLADVVDYRFGRIGEAMKFGRMVDRARTAAG